MEASSPPNTLAFGQCCILFSNDIFVVLINEISVHDALLTRLSNDDDMEKSLSTFANEMASSAMILGIFFVSCMSLLLTDE